MSKIFKSAAHTGRTVEVDGREVGAFVLVRHEDKAAGTTISKLEAPAFALAILEAAGFEADIDDASSLANSAMGRLAMHVSTEATKAKEAADREALEAEALVLLRACWEEPHKEWFGQTTATQEKWLMMARTARELHGGTK